MRQIALCFFGLIRSFEKTWPLIQKNFLLEKDDILDVFITTSNYDDKKYRFKVISKKYFNINELEKKIRNLIGNKLKVLNIMDDREKKVKRVERIINLFSNLIEYENKNKIEYDIIIFHRMDILFVSWGIADQYYEERKVGEERKKGLLYLPQYKFPIGVKNHGCCCIQGCPEHIDTYIKLNKLGDNEIICYEDFWIGHVPTDFFICNNNVIKKILRFWKNYKNKKYLQIDRSGKMNTFQSYELFKKRWFLYEDSKIESCETQIRLFFENENIKLKELRYNQDIAVLYIR